MRGSERNFQRGLHVAFIPPEGSVFCKSHTKAGPSAQDSWEGRMNDLGQGQGLDSVVLALWSIKRQLLSTWRNRRTSLNK